MWARDLCDTPLRRKATRRQPRYLPGHPPPLSTSPGFLVRVEAHTKTCNYSNQPGGLLDCVSCAKWHPAAPTLTPDPSPKPNPNPKPQPQPQPRPRP